MNPDVSLWLVLAGILLIAELATGTFYLLMLSMGALLGAAVAQMGLDLPWQMATASVFAVLGTLGLRHWRSRKTPGKHASANNNLDIGNTVEVDGWSTHGLAIVHYRGSNWSARSATQPPSAGLHTIIGVEGNTLLLKNSNIE